MAPTAPPHPCSEPLCRGLVPRGERYCETHRRSYNRQLSAQRGTTKQRGYDGAWERFRKWVLARRPLCEAFCAKEGRTEVATELHHVVALRAGGARLDEDNVMPVCGPCHRKITAQESR